MTDSEANKVIAKFMKDSGFSLNNLKPKNYCESLDLLVPVWDKLELEAWFSRVSFFGKNTKFHCKLHFEIGTGRDGEYWVANNATIQQAAAHCTALAIIDLKNTSHE